MEKFTATIQHNPENGGAWVEVPFDVKEKFDSLRPKVKVLFDEKEEYRGSLVRMGGQHILGIRKDIRNKIGKQPGDEVKVEVEVDTEPRIVSVPKELEQALKDSPQAWKNFEKMSYSHQREYVNYISEAKKEETRLRRAAMAIGMLQQNQSL